MNDRWRIETPYETALPEEVKIQGIARAPNTIGGLSVGGILGGFLLGPIGALIGGVLGGLVGYEKDKESTQNRVWVEY